MGDCIYCGKPAGFLRSVHDVCETKKHAGEKEISSLIEKAIAEGGDCKLLERKMDGIANLSFIKEPSLKAILIKSWRKAVKEILDKGVVTEEYEKNMTALHDYFCLTQSELDEEYTKFVKGIMIRELLNGNIPEKVVLGGIVPFNLQKSEKIIWLFNNAQYKEVRNTSVYSGGSSGFSVKVAKGFYYRSSGFSGASYNCDVTRTYHGILGITNKHIYFCGDSKSLRLNYEKIISFIPGDDGIRVDRDALTAKPQLFITGDGWFTYNLVANLARISAGVKSQKLQDNLSSSNLESKIESEKVSNRLDTTKKGTTIVSKPTPKTLGSTTKPGYLNKNGQKNIGKVIPEMKGSDRNQYVYRIGCSNCGYEYGTNGSDIFLRKCPNCQNGAIGINLP